MLEYKLPNAEGHMITVGATATSLFDAINSAITTAGGTAIDFEPEGLDAAYISVQTNAIRILTDGNTPTATIGDILDSAGNNTGYNLYGEELKNIKMIRSGASDATVYVRIGKAIRNY